MIKIYLQRRSGTLFGTLFRCDVLFVVFFISLLSTNVLSDESSVASCEREGFQNSYYFIDVETIADVSDFFVQIPDIYLISDDSYFSVEYGQRNRVETYFDDNNLNLLKFNRELVLILNEEIPEYKSEREEAVFRDNSTTPSNVISFEAKRYNKKSSALDKHVFFGRIKRRLRPQLIENLELLTGVSIANVGAELKVGHRETILMYRHYGKNYGAITLDRVHISNYGVPNTFSLLKFEINSKNQDQLKKIERENLHKVFCGASEQLKKHYPQMLMFNRFGYAEFYKLAENLLPTRRLFSQYPKVYELGQIIVLIMIGCLFLYLLIGRYSKHKGYRSITTQSKKKTHE